MLNRYYKLSQIFFINFMLLLGGVLAVATIVIYYSVQQIEIKQYTGRLRSEIAYVQRQIRRGNEPAQLAKTLEELTGRPLRVTLIDWEGRPLFDNRVDRGRLGNQGSRPEVAEAKRKGFATAVRYSSTDGKDYLYVAKKIDRANRPVILRLSLPLDTVMGDFQRLWVRIALVFLAALLAGLYLSWVIRWRIDEELEKITDFLRHLAQKHYSAPFLPGFTAEFRTIGKLLKKLARRLEKNERKRRKYIARLRLIGRQRSDVISAIGHEFKNPVAAIMGYTETLLEDPGLSADMRRKFLERIEQNSRRIIGMIDRLSFVARLEGHEIEPQMSRFDIQKVLIEAVAAMEQKYPQRKIRCETAPMVVEADRTMMEMVVVNLIDNALKYSDEDVEVTLVEGRLCVKDSGRGIAPKDLQRVTEKYYRVEKNSWDNSMGLGLAIVSYILKLHGTQLHIDSAPGVGTTICFDIPACDENDPNQKK
ncbi:ATP-binding protein [Hydrogenimonas sp. SS33]|uniref:sensor histidine kinase n=1 Tax=Hydrogenimonas leucolamina TaxID=2954236 RepID=UPI00336BE0BD